MINEEEDIIRAIAGLNFWGRDIDTGVPRPQYSERVRKFANSGEIAVVIGPRRSGKTTICQQALESMIRGGLEKSQTLCINFEEPAIEHLLSGPSGIEKIYRSYRMLVNRDKPAVVVLDEVQNVPRWEKWVRAMHEKKEAKLIITGSSSKLLSSEIASVLTGRTLSVFVFPLDFREFLRFMGIELKEKYQAAAKKDAIKSFLMEYMSLGAFPGIAKKGEEFTKKALLKEYFDGFIFRDVVKRYKIRDVDMLRNLAELCINNTSSLISASRMREALVPILQRKISPNKVVKFMSYLENSFLLFFVPIFSYKVKEQKLYPKKTYAVDTGMAKAVSFKFLEELGRLAENIVFLHLKRASYEKGYEIFYWKDKEQKEVDFIVKKQLKVSEAIQVSWDISDSKTKERETRSLLKAMSEFGLKQGLVITGDFEGEEKINGRKIIYAPLWKWLLEF